jgi:hypothetical protein
VGLGLQDHLRLLDLHVHVVRLFQTFKKPRIHTVVVDEYGNYTWTQIEIPQVQKVERYILLAVMVIWSLMAFRFLALIGEAQDSPHVTG